MWKIYTIPFILAAVAGVIGALIGRKWPWLLAWFSVGAQDRINKGLREELGDGERRYKTLQRDFEELQVNFDTVNKELATANEDREGLRQQVVELESAIGRHFIQLIETNQRQQGEIDKLKHQVTEALDIKGELRDFIKEEIRDVRQNK